MPEPVALKLCQESPATVHRVNLDPAIVNRLVRDRGKPQPAVLAVTSVALLEQMGAGVVDLEDVRVLCDGDWSEAYLIVAPIMDGREKRVPPSDDSEFLADVDRLTPELGDLARKLIAAIRGRGIEGHLRQEGVRWVNRPLNTFTIAIQTRVRNFQFTLYGGPERFGVTDFIKSDQNGYSRGWIRSERDIPEFIELAAIAYARKRKQ